MSDKKTDLKGKTVIITGANSGIGLETARELAGRGARIILACRSLERGEAARLDIVSSSGNNDVTVRVLDLFDFMSVRRFCQQINTEEARLDILVNNAAVFGLSQPPSKHGIEVTMATNHFGPFLLTVLLIDLLKRSAPSRVVNVASEAQSKCNSLELHDLHSEKTQSAMATFRVYARSKLANVIFTKELSRRLTGSGVTTYSLHPGMVKTGIARNLSTFWKILMVPISWFILQRADKGAETSVYLAVTSADQLTSGGYYIDCELAEQRLNVSVQDAEVIKQLWDKSTELTEAGEAADIK